MTTTTPAAAASPYDLDDNARNAGILKMEDIDDSKISVTFSNTELLADFNEREWKEKFERNTKARAKAINTAAEIAVAIVKIHP
jgi:hypothetical protein